VESPREKVHEITVEEMRKIKEYERKREREREREHANTQHRISPRRRVRGMRAYLLACLLVCLLATWSTSTIDSWSGGTIDTLGDRSGKYANAKGNSEIPRSRSRVSIIEKGFSIKAVVRSRSRDPGFVVLHEPLCCPFIQGN